MRHSSRWLSSVVGDNFMDIRVLPLGYHKEIHISSTKVSKSVMLYREIDPAE